MAQVEGEGEMPDNIIEVWSSYCQFTKMPTTLNCFPVNTDVPEQMQLNLLAEIVMLAGMEIEIKYPVPKETQTWGFDEGMKLLPQWIRARGGVL